MQHISLYITSALVMLFLEYFVLLRLYKRSRQLEIVSLIVAPIMIVIALWLTLFIQDRLNLGIKSTRVNPVLLFVVIILFELPLSLYGYEIKPDASILERCIVAGTFGTVSVLIAQSILLYF
jgi:hypothetical protein